MGAPVETMASPMKDRRADHVKSRLMKGSKNPAAQTNVYKKESVF